MYIDKAKTNNTKKKKYLSIRQSYKIYCSVQLNTKIWCPFLCVWKWMRTKNIWFELKLLFFEYITFYVHIFYLIFNKFKNFKLTFRLCISFNSLAYNLEKICMHRFTYIYLVYHLDICMYVNLCVYAIETIKLQYDTSGHWQNYLFIWNSAAAIFVNSCKISSAGGIFQGNLRLIPDLGSINYVVEPLKLI